MLHNIAMHSYLTWLAEWTQQLFRFIISFAPNTFIKLSRQGDKNQCFMHELLRLSQYCYCYAIKTQQAGLEGWCNMFIKSWVQWNMHISLISHYMWATRTSRPKDGTFRMNGLNIFEYLYSATIKTMYHTKSPYGSNSTHKNVFLMRDWVMMK